MSSVQRDINMYTKMHQLHVPRSPSYTKVAVEWSFMGVALFNLYRRMGTALIQAFFDSSIQVSQIFYCLRSLPTLPCRVFHASFMNSLGS